MSAYVVEKETMDRAVFLIQRELPVFAGFTTTTRDGCNAIGAALYRLNRDAVQYRYENRYNMTDDAEAMAAAYVYSPAPGRLATPVQLLKSLDCLIYQCSEGNVIEDPLYGAIEEVAERVAAGNVRKTRDYEQAAWG